MSIVQIINNEKKNTTFRKLDLFPSSALHNEMSDKLAAAFFSASGAALSSDGEMNV
jgi:hypothetical protein